MTLTINGLVIFNAEYDLGDLASMELQRHFAEEVIWVLGAFLIVADEFEDFARAIQEKLIHEINGPLFANDHRMFETQIAGAFAGDK